MPPELRKRKAVETAPAPEPKKQNPVTKAINKAKAKVQTAAEAKARNDKVAEAKPSNGAAVADKAEVGSTISDLEAFGGEVETNDGEKTTLKKLLDKSKSGVVLFTYPKASTPGCTTQVCLFRDSYEPLTSTGFLIYGLSTDSPKANTTFKTKQNLPYPLLCDPSATLISAIGLKKEPKGTTRGVFVIDKSGKVLAAEPGGPAATVDVVKRLIESSGDSAKAEEVPKVEEVANGNGAEATKEDADKADVAADVADTAEKLDSNVATSRL